MQWRRPGRYLTDEEAEALSHKMVVEQRRPRGLSAVIVALVGLGLFAYLVIAHTQGAHTPKLNDAARHVAGIWVRDRLAAKACSSGLSPHSPYLLTRRIAQRWCAADSLIRRQNLRVASLAVDCTRRYENATFGAPQGNEVADVCAGYAVRGPRPGSPVNHELWVVMNQLGNSWTVNSFILAHGRDLASPS